MLDAARVLDRTNVRKYFCLLLTDGQNGSQHAGDGDVDDESGPDQGQGCEMSGSRTKMAMFQPIRPDKEFKMASLGKYITQQYANSNINFIFFILELYTVISALNFLLSILDFQPHQNNFSNCIKIPEMESIYRAEI